MTTLPFPALQKAEPDKQGMPLWDVVIAVAVTGLGLGLFWQVLQTLYM